MLSKNSIIVKATGWIGGGAFALCGLPQAYQAFSNGHAEGVNPWFIGLWMTGEVFSMFYVYHTHGLDKPLFANYTLNLVFISIIMYYLI